jgi:hypothetical protein
MKYPQPFVLQVDDVPLVHGLGQRCWRYVMVFRRPSQERCLCYRARQTAKYIGQGVLISHLAESLCLGCMPKASFELMEAADMIGMDTSFTRGRLAGARLSPRRAHE